MARTRLAESLSWEAERAIAGCGAGLLAGVDEAGRGPWAGPVVAAAVMFRSGETLEGLNDSKKLTAARRFALYEAIVERAIVGVAIVPPEEIDRLNILRATIAAMRRAVAGLCDAPAAALIDGDRCPDLPCRAEAVVGGDARCPSIAAASIVAKVTRDRLMVELSDDFPDYGWRENKGYGTRAHSEAIARFGVTPHHRRSFAPIRAALEKACRAPP